ncbi:DNA damage-binding protein 1a, partial [Nowakowskiella sp. JEL0078]
IRSENNKTSVFAASDRPNIIHASAGKINYSSVNLREVNYVCSFNIQSAPHALALATPLELKIGSIDGIQKLHIRKVPMGQLTRRLTFQSETNTFTVL